MKKIKVEKTPGVSPAARAAEKYRLQKKQERELAEARGEEYW